MAMDNYCCIYHCPLCLPAVCSCDLEVCTATAGRKSKLFERDIRKYRGSVFPFLFSLPEKGKECFCLCGIFCDISGMPCFVEVYVCEWCGEIPSAILRDFKRYSVLGVKNRRSK